MFILYQIGNFYQIKENIILRDAEVEHLSHPVRKAMAVVSLLKEYDYKGKGGDVGEATPEELMVELVARILNV